MIKLAVQNPSTVKKRNNTLVIIAGNGNERIYIKLGECWKFNCK